MAIAAWKQVGRLAHATIDPCRHIGDLYAMLGFRAEAKRYYDLRLRRVRPAGQGPRRSTSPAEARGDGPRRSQGQARSCRHARSRREHRGGGGRVQGCCPRADREGEATGSVPGPEQGPPGSIQGAIVSRWSWCVSPRNSESDARPNKEPNVTKHGRREWRPSPCATDASQLESVVRRTMTGAVGATSSLGLG